jgi:hypothetical protein
MREDPDDLLGMSVSCEVKIADSPVEKDIAESSSNG